MKSTKYETEWNSWSSEKRKHLWYASVFLPPCPVYFHEADEGDGYLETQLMNEELERNGHGLF